MAIFSSLIHLFSVTDYKRDRIFGLDIYRAVAIFLVVYLHGHAMARPYTNHLPFLTYVDGVELFFVLSGFLIGGILIKLCEEKGPLTLSLLLHFWKQRWFRTLPAYYIVLTVLLLWKWVLHETPESWIRYYGFLQNVISPHPDFFRVAWSLSIEEWFYVTFPLCLWLTSLLVRRPGLRKWGWFGVCGGFILAGFFIRHYLLPELFPDTLAGVGRPLHRKMVITRLDSIIFGVSGALAKYFYPAIWAQVRFAAVLPALVLLTVPMISYDLSGRVTPEQQHLTLHTLNPIAYLLLLPLADSIKTARGRLAAIITNISVVSYSVYLTHNDIVRALLTTFVAPGNGPESILTFTAYLLLAWMLGIVMYKYIERPLMNLRDRF